MKHQEKYEEKKQKNFNCMTNHNGKTPQPESMASDFYFIKEASLARRK
jgi:ribosomal protein S19E (S16A)